MLGPCFLIAWNIYMSHVIQDMHNFVSPKGQYKFLYEKLSGEWLVTFKHKPLKDK